MPSFDIVSEVDSHELTNAVDQADRELTTRFDFKGVDASFARDGNVITQSAPSEFQLQQMADILRARLAARKIDIRCLDSATSKPMSPARGGRSPSSRASSASWRRRSSPR